MTDALADREIEILQGLAERLVTFESSLIPASDLCGELDWYVFSTSLLSFG